MFYISLFIFVKHINTLNLIARKRTAKRKKMKNMHSKSTDEDEEDDDGSKDSDPVGKIVSLPFSAIKKYTLKTNFKQTFIIFKGKQCIKHDINIKN